MQDREIYLDHAATTPLDPEVAGRISQVQADVFGNPSSPHTAGRARQIVDDAREQILATLGCPTARLIFTSGATEANHLVTLGLQAAQPILLAVSPRDHESLRLAAAAAGDAAGLETLPLRIREHVKNGSAVADFLAAHPAVAKVNYPRLQKGDAARRAHAAAPARNACMGSSA